MTSVDQTRTRSEENEAINTRGIELANLSILSDNLDGDSEAIRSIADDFKVDLEQDHCELEKAIESSDWNNGLRIAHQLKGTAAAVGCGPLASAAERIEVRIRTNSLTGISQDMQNLTVILPVSMTALDLALKKLEPVVLNVG